MAAGRRQYYFLITLILSLTITSIIYATEPTFEDANEPKTTVGILGLSPGHPYRFNADQAQSQIVVTANVLGNTKSDTSPVTGWLDVTLTPGQSPFVTAHITDLDLELTEQIYLDYGFFVGWAKGTDIGVDMYEAGPAAPVNTDNSFLQTGNYLTGRGLFEYSFLFGAEQGSIDLSTMGPVFSDIIGLVSQNGTTITLQIDMDIEYPLESDGTQLGTAWIQGTVIATAEVFWAPADLFSDGIVNFKDFAVFAAAWPYTLGDPQYNPDCDLHQPSDGLIDARDLLVFADNWLEGM